MPFNPSGATEVALEVFGGLITQTPPTNVPKGASPDCSDVVFSPGQVASRPGLARVFADAFPAGGPSGFIPTLTYAKSYVDPVGVIRNLYLDSNGSLWVENLTVSPGNKTMLVGTTPGSWAKSITAFGREYIAISDGLHGADVPLQYDGTNLDRVTQDGPGASPTVSSITLPATVLAATGAPPVMTVTEVDPTGLDPDSTYYSAINIYVNNVGTTQPGAVVTIAGNTQAVYNTTWVITDVLGTNLLIATAYLASTAVIGTGGTATTGSGTTLRRAGNIVTAKTTAAHGLQVGYQAQISNVPASIVGTAISSIVIKNESLPGRATIVTSAAHGLVPGLFVSLQGITAAAVGGAITAIARAGQVVTATTTTAHGLTPGASVTLAGVADASFNATFTVQQVISTTKYVFIQAGADATSSGGTTSINWPLTDSPTPRYFQVIAAPTPTSLQILVNYSDGTWASGTVSYAWEGTFFVSAVVDSTTFQYRQYGPDATTTAAGTVTPHGQIAPGEHQLRVSFLTRQGYVTRPSPPVRFIANGGQYLSVTNLPIGPSNIVARVIQLTGAQGSAFFYIPVPAQVNGQQVSTATQVSDNTSGSVVLDFSDNTLFAGIGTSIPGNNLPNEIVLDGALAFGQYGSRLITHGQRNTVQGLLNMGFDGGFLPSVFGQYGVAVPTGWIPLGAGGVGGVLNNSGHYGPCWQINVTPGGARGTLEQGFYQDAYGAPISVADQQYTIRVWLKPSALAADLTFAARLRSDSLAYASVATITGAQMNLNGSFVEASFSLKTPDSIPPDLVFEFWAESTVFVGTLLVDEMSLIYADVPYLETALFGSYVDNPEGFDGVSGRFGAIEDTRKVMGMGMVRQTLYLLTQDPSGRMHAVINNGVTEPVGWQVSEVAGNCGLMSTFGLTVSQADDAMAGGGEEWLAWISASGARIFGGDQPWKISQEIQPNWDAANAEAMTFSWALNDPVARLIYFGIPVGSATAPSMILHVNYRDLDTASQIAAADPMTGQERVRKWSPWNLPINGAALMYRAQGILSTILLGGNGSAPGAIAGFGNAYTLAVGQMTDADYGQIDPYYTTFFFAGDGVKQILLAYLTGQLSGFGSVSIKALVNSLTSIWPLDCTRDLIGDPTFDLEWGGASAQGYRIAFLLRSIPPAENTDNQFQLQRLAVAIRPAARLPVRGASR